ncbi:glutaminyl-peptide cyclotransferase [Flavobacterium sp.]|uniref:glutaminyl-peptide cyclotransferase n=1 Tax=Flavobacterium sp. TaxID=239 RepID=UPI003B9B17FC
MKIRLQGCVFGCIFFLLFAITACNSPKPADFELRFNSADKKYLSGKELIVEVSSEYAEKISAVKLFLNEKLVATGTANSVKAKIEETKLGYIDLRVAVTVDGADISVSDRVEVVTDVTPKVYSYSILNTYPHDISSFTEGFEFFRDTLLEGTGLRGQSKLLKTDYKTGKILKSLTLDSQYFGEGITVINNQIFQLTWEEGKGFIYDANSWKLIKEFTYDKQIEGWGMTNDGSYIYHSDGTEKIWKMDPNTQKMIGYVNVYLGSEKIKQVNELEWVEGKIFGNVWQKDAIAIINPESGVVEGILDLSALRSKVKGGNPAPEVLNGIAYRKSTKTLFVTGKYWDKVFEIQVK